MANNPRAAVDQALFSVLQNAYPWAYSSMHFQGWGSFSDKQPAMFLRRIRERIVSPKGPMLLKYTYEYECWIYLQTQKDDPNINPYFGNSFTQLGSDNFHRADSNPMSGSWIAQSTGTGWAADQIISDQVYGTATNDASCASQYTGITWPADQYSTITIGAYDTSAEPAVGIALRGQSPGIQKDYELYIYNDMTLGVGVWEMVYDEGNLFHLLASGELPRVPQSGDTVTGVIQGTRISLLWNGLLQGEASDSTLSSGSAGLSILLSTTSEINAVSISSWVGGSVAGNNIGIDPIVDAIDSALAASPVSGKNTLGGLVNECYIDGTIMLADGTDDGQCVIRIPIVTTTAI